MSTVIVSDVFGKTPALMALSEQLQANTIVDPYDGRNMGFSDETQAYAHFIEHVGFDGYLAKLLKIIESTSAQMTLIGFSVGASAIWQMSEKLSASKVKRAVCFYGSQIRNYTDINPQFEIDLVFPKSEPHFDVLTLEAMLANKTNVSTFRVEYLHGFMNQCSTNYHEVGYRALVEMLCLDKI
ncbi:hypothetical protein [Thalassotalea sp. ND16A]|uniref:hypothetical protein n=1 Tax=Thalassotalea sp. ND16A TaxID=1535422 RepID=UPI00051A1239|nr:hypothetical protein [Thalassotalea sp. ND16A]KGJ93372.1 hypothetical protein ND16A_1530 [Thalassotalea sp. ND16A]